MAAPSAAPQAGGDETGETSRYYPVCLPMQIIHQDRSSELARASRISCHRGAGGGERGAET